MMVEELRIKKLKIKDDRGCWDNLCIMKDSEGGMGRLD
jgi:hypothetical protein